MTKVYRFEIQIPIFHVTIEDDSDTMTKSEARRFVIRNLQEYIDNEDLKSDAVVSDGMELE